LEREEWNKKGVTGPRKGEGGGKASISNLKESRMWLLSERRHQDGFQKKEECNGELEIGKKKRGENRGGKKTRPVIGPLKGRRKHTRTWAEKKPTEAAGGAASDKKGGGSGISAQKKKGRR